MFRKKEKPQEVPLAKKEELLLKIIPIIAGTLDIKEERITLLSRLKEDLGADSLDAIEIIMALEEVFNIEISDEDAEKIQTVDEIIEYLAKRREI